MRPIHSWRLAENRVSPAPRSPIKNLAAPEAEMNVFRRGHRVLAVEKEFVPDGEDSCWTFCVEYLTRGALSKFVCKKPISICARHAYANLNV